MDSDGQRQVGPWLEPGPTRRRLHDGSYSFVLLSRPLAGKTEGWKPNPVPYWAEYSGLLRQGLVNQCIAARKFR